MQQYKIDFIKLLVEAEALKFGEFTYKSGRVGPYFFNAGSFYTGELLNQLGEAYAGAFVDAGFESQIVYGPAYKGIPLSVITVSALQTKFDRNLSYSFDRKAPKGHGMKDNFIGAPFDENSKLILVDDVVTAGTAVRETMVKLKENGGPQVEGLIISLDRMEKYKDGVSAIGALSEEFGMKVVPIITLDEVIEALYNKEVEGRVYIDDEMMGKIKEYRAEYGI